jgi:peptide chain release factor 1
MDSAMEARLEGIQRSYRALTERLADPDVIADSNLLRKVMSDRSQMEEVVQVYEEYVRLKNNWFGAKELFLEAEDDDAELKEMARSEMKAIEPQLEELEKKVTVLMLPKDPNDSRNVMLEIRAGTGGSEANLFAGKYLLAEFAEDESPQGMIPTSRLLCM